MLELRRYPRQFVVSDCPTNRLNDLNSFQMGRFHVYHCPTLLVYTKQEDVNHNFAVLFGYATHHDRIDLSESELLGEILKYNSINEIAEYISKLDGRFSIFFSLYDDGYVFHDPTGLRTVYFITTSSQNVFGTQPLILGEFAALEAGYKAELFFHSNYFRTADEYWIPSGLSLYENVEQLVPNHYLALSTKKQIRYWPTFPIKKLDFNGLVGFLSEYLVESIRNASKKFDLALPLTSGLDSRLLLAASKDVINDLTFYTRIHKSSIGPRHHDLVIPAKILKLIGKKHNIIAADRPVPATIEERYKLNNSTSRFQDSATLFSSGAEIIKNKHVMYGNVSELIKIRKPDQEYLSLNDFEVLPKGWLEISFIQSILQSWFASAVDIEKKHEIHPYELFYWEHRLGNWAARAYNENDFIFDIFTPLNSRAVLSAVMMLDINMRALPEAKLHRAVIKNLWPEIDVFLYNKIGSDAIIKSMIKKVGRVTRLNRLVYSLNEFLNR